MHIDTFGDGPDLVLIHGWAMHAGIFGAFAEQLAMRFRVYAVDLPGHGHAREKTSFDTQQTAADIAAATPRAIWVGWSLGGVVALHAAVRHPHSLRGLVMIASNPRFVAAPDWPHGVEARVFAEFAEELRVRYRHAVERFLALETLGSPHAHDELRVLRHAVFARGEPNANALADGLQALADSDFTADLSRLTMPSLWIGGRRDRLVPPTALKMAAQHAPNGHYVEFNSGHAPFLDQPAAMVDAIAAFAEECPP